MVTFAFIAFLLCAAINRFLVSRSVQALSVEQKALLVDISASRRPWFFVVLAAVVLVWAVSTTHFGHRNWLFAALFVLLLVFGVPTIILRLVRLSRLGLPQVYVRSAWIGGLLVTFGLVVMLGAMAYKTWTFVY